VAVDVRSEGIPLADDGTTHQVRVVLGERPEGPTR